MCLPSPPGAACWPWPRMLAVAAAEYAQKAPWVVLFPGITISPAVFGANLLGDAPRDTLDSSLRNRWPPCPRPASQPIPFCPVPSPMHRLDKRGGGGVAFGAFIRQPTTE